MAYNKTPQYYAFTSKANGLALDLQTEIGISLPYVRTDSGEAPKISEKQAIWDTGAQGTVISAAVAKELNLKPSGRMNVHGVNSTIESNTYLVNLYLPSHIVIPYVQVTEGNIGCDVLVGMDIITLGDFTITNFNHKTTFSFRYPSKQEIDFVKEIKASSKSQKKKQSGKIRRTDRCYCGSGKMYKNCHGK